MIFHRHVLYLLNNWSSRNYYFEWIDFSFFFLSFDNLPLKVSIFVGLNVIYQIYFIQSQHYANLITDALIDFSHLTGGNLYALPAYCKPPPIMMYLCNTHYLISYKMCDCLIIFIIDMCGG
jgi:hypothetical protein